MSLWSDIQDKNGKISPRKEDIIEEEENLWGVYFTDDMWKIPDNIQKIIDDDIKHTTELGRSIKKLQERLTRLKEVTSKINI